MRYELHCAGQVFVNTDISVLRGISREMKEEWVIYRILQSKMNLYVPIKKQKTIKAKTQGMTPLPYDIVERAYQMENRGRTRVETCRLLRITPERLRPSMIHYLSTKDRNEYETMPMVVGEKEGLT